MPEEQVQNPGLQKLVLGNLHSPYDREIQVNSRLWNVHSLKSRSFGSKTEVRT